MRDALHVDGAALLARDVAVDGHVAVLQALAVDDDLLVLVLVRAEVIGFPGSPEVVM